MQEDIPTFPSFIQSLKKLLKEIQNSLLCFLSTFYIFFELGMDVLRYKGHCPITPLAENTSP